ncbi:MAG: polymerase subunit gamma/tau [Candidatus Parcubacteria bacterium]|jgi:DNA polymerase-3 subunit gamma/tau|nr:polymerase subunit gamma/tau [Candidatus Parcubacteria bacterium]
MSHQSLYRAYRPQSFKDVRGQDQVVLPLKEQLENKTVAHAYLFAGSRGLGKTSIARIFAKELGTEGSDLYEIDAASNNSVEDIRALTENVYTLPFSSPYKVYILDEAHMLSKSAWNAFLKTLEEPPAHAIFILATTELDRVPETVQSRCQVYEFRKPSREGLSKHVAEVAKKEGYAIEPSVSDLIALLADGSYRDALSVLEKVLASSKDKKITREEAERATGAPRLSLIEDLARALHEGDAGAALLAIRKTNEADVDMRLYLTLLLEYLRNVLLIRHAPELRKELGAELGEDLYSAMEKLAAPGDSKLTHQTLKTFLDAASRIRYAPIPALALELAVYELLGEQIA